MSLIEREVGQFPVSVGTSLAFEGFLGVHPKQPKQPIDVKSVKEIWVNIRTLARNLWNAMPTEDLSTVNPNQAVMVLLQETQTLPVLLEQAKSRAKIKYYITSRDNFKWAFPKATYKVAKTPRQMAYEVFERYVSMNLFRQLQEVGLDPIEIERHPKKQDGTIAILTHYPHELLWKEHFNRLVLLESNTGKLKPYNLWYTKLNGVDENEPIPFNRFTLQVFGEKVLIEAQPRAIKGQVKQLAISKKWNPTTDIGKIYHDISQYGSKELKDAYKLLR